MADLTPFLNSLLEKHKACTRRAPSQPKDEFLKEAYRIVPPLSPIIPLLSSPPLHIPPPYPNSWNLQNTHITSLTTYLRSIRAPYLSTAPPPFRSSSSSSKPHHPHIGPPDRTYLTDSQREAIDASSKTLIRDLNASITQLSQAETVRQQTVDQIAVKKRGKVGSALLRWAEGDSKRGRNAQGKGEGEVSGEEMTTRVWREGVLFYLQVKLGEVGEVQRGMMSRRLEREVERSKSVLYKTKGVGLPGGLVDERWGVNGFGENNGGGGGGGPKGGGGGDQGRMGAVEMEEERKRVETQLSPEQLQLFEKENNDMLKHYEDTLDQVRYGFPPAIPLLRFPSCCYSPSLRRENESFFADT